MTTELAAADLLRTAARAAIRKGMFTVSSYLMRAAEDHERQGGCPATPAPCGYEVEARRVLDMGW